MACLGKGGEGVNDLQHSVIVFYSITETDLLLSRVPVTGLLSTDGVRTTVCTATTYVSLLSSRLYKSCNSLSSRGEHLIIHWINHSISQSINHSHQQPCQCRYSQPSITRIPDGKRCTFRQKKTTTQSPQTSWFQHPRSHRTRAPHHRGRKPQISNPNPDPSTPHT